MPRRTGGGVTVDGVGITYLVEAVDDRDPTGKLTAAEREVAMLAAAGLSNDAIAKRRGVASRTIANQLASIYDKLGVGSRIELIALVNRRAPRRG